MDIKLHELVVPLKRPFTISRGTVCEQPILIVELEYEGTSGFGEATANDYYGHSIASIKASIESVRDRLATVTLDSGDAVWNILHDSLADDSFALAALDIACHDLFGKLRGQPCHELWGLQWDNRCHSSLTIGINDVETMVTDLVANPGWRSYKIKLGVDNDLEIVAALQQQTNAELRVDANCAWSADEAIEKSRALRELDVQFIEQPLPPDAPRAEHERLFAKSHLPVIADESCCLESDVESCQGAFHGINVKLCKCGGLTPALRMLQHARALGMSTMVGCMVESSVGISAAAQLLPLLNFADLDGAILLGNDPAIGVTLDHGIVLPPKLPGCGVELVASVSQCHSS